MAGDDVGKFMALVSLAPIFLIAQMAALLAVRRDVQTASLLIGQLLNEVVNYVLKNAIRESRPPDDDECFCGSDSCPGYF